jgi:tryptophan-rich sensory protein
MIPQLILCIAVCMAAALVGSSWTTPALVPWYAGLSKPSWTPPNWLFGPVWTALYIMMAVAAWLVWRRTGLTSAPMALFLVQLLLNMAWSGIFFRLRSPGAGFADIVMLWLAIAATLTSFWRVAPVAGWLLVPYLLWVSYASALNYSIWRRNA